MATKHSGLIQLDFGAQRETIYLHTVPSSQHLAAFLEVYKTFTNAGIRKYAFVTTEYINEIGQQIMSENVDEVLMVQLEYLDGDNMRHIITIPIPAPKRSLLEFVEGAGYRLPSEQGDLLAQAYKQLTGEVHTFKNGWIIA